MHHERDFDVKVFNIHAKFEMNRRALPSVLFVLCAVFLAGCGENLIDMASSWESLGCCGIIILVLDIIAIIEVAGSSRNTTAKFIWILFIVLVPFLGLIGYYIFADRS